MQYITTTQLRTKSTSLIESLLRGEEVELIHRSKVIGKIQPKKEEHGPLTAKDIEDIQNAAESLKLPKLSYGEREGRYRKYLLKRYGKGLS